MKTRMLFATTALLAALPAIAVDAASSKVVAFNASVKVEVDAAGKPVKVEAPSDLPDAIRSFIEKRVASWQYQPANINGIPQSAITYVEVRACAVPVAQGYRLGVDYEGNGPRTADDHPLLGPMYPPEAQRGGTEAEFVLVLGVETNGRVVIDQVERKTVSGRAGATTFEPFLQRWTKTLRFDPEQVAGKPVRGQVRVPVSFLLRNPGDRQGLMDELQAKASATPECQLAAGSGEMKSAAVRPAVEVTPVPAS